MPKKEKKKSWKERQRERQIRQQRAQEAHELQREREVAKKPRKWPKIKILGAVCLVVLIFGAIMAWQYTKPPLIPTGRAIYIRADGSVDIPTTPILNIGNIYYTFTADIYDSIVIERDNIVVDGANFALQGTGAYDSKGIDLSGRSNVTISNIKIKGFGYGVYLNSTSDSVLSQNDLKNNLCGIWLNYSSNNDIYGNNITANNVNGVWLDYSSNNVISRNTFFNCGLVVRESSGNVVVDNLANGKPLVYLEGVSDYSVDNAGQVILVSCTDILVENLNLSNASVGVQLFETSNTHITNNKITNNEYGIRLDYSTNNSISRNNITANNGGGISLIYSSNNRVSENKIAANGWDGIYLAYSFDNTISGNNITNNECGIDLHESSNNRNYHNNFIDNAEQTYSYASTNVWDDGYPSAGNYWSDYEERYPEADELDGSGIWNTPYVIDENNQDNYPLMNL